SVKADTIRKDIESLRSKLPQATGDAFPVQAAGSNSAADAASVAAPASNSAGDATSSATTSASSQSTGFTQSTDIAAQDSTSAGGAGGFVQDTEPTAAP